MQAERRVAQTRVRVERRAKGDGTPGDPEIVGHAAVYDVWTTLYEGKYWTWREIVRQGCFANALKEKQDVRCLFNHDRNFILGRTTAGTCILEDDPPTGLLSRTIPSESRTVNDLVLIPMGRGEIDGMSFAFECRRGGTVVRTEAPDGSVVVEGDGERVTYRYEGDRLIEERELLDCDLFDVSPCVYPQYTGTDVGLRSITGLAERAKEMDRPHPKQSKRGAWLAKAHVRLRLAESDI